MLQRRRTVCMADSRRIALGFICFLLNILLLNCVGGFALTVALMSTNSGTLVPIETLFMVTVSGIARIYLEVPS